jgi:hypothetical protein
VHRTARPFFFVVTEQLSGVQRFDWPRELAAPDQLRRGRAPTWESRKSASLGRTSVWLIPYWIPVRLMLGITGPKRQILGAELAGIVEAAGPAAPITAAKNKTNPAVR